MVKSSLNTYAYNLRIFGMKKITILVLIFFTILATISCQAAKDPEVVELIDNTDIADMTDSTATSDSTGTADTTAIRYLALGDSYTIGESVAPSECWSIQLVDTLRGLGYLIKDPLIIARTGWTTDELAAAINRTDPDSSFGLVSLLIGVNNQYRGRSSANFRLEFRDLLSQAIAFASDDTNRVFVLSIPDWGITPFAAGRDREKIAEEIDVYNAIKREECMLAGITYIDITDISRRAAEDASLLAPDGLHPSAKMYLEWVLRALPEIERILNL
jgi:lysophospholipase L1-like esterase